MPVSDSARRRLARLKVAMVPVFIVGLWLTATVIGAPLGIPTVVLAFVVWRDASSVLAGTQDSRRLAVFCTLMAIVAATSTGVSVLLGFDDLYNDTANLAALGVGIAWVVVVFQAREAAVANARPPGP